MASIVGDLGEPLEHEDCEGEVGARDGEGEDDSAMRPAQIADSLDDGSIQTVRANPRLRCVGMILTNAKVSRDAVV